MLSELLSKMRELILHSKRSIKYENLEFDDDEGEEEVNTPSLNIVTRNSEPYNALIAKGPPAWEYDSTTNKYYPFDHAFFGMQSLIDSDLHLINYMELVGQPCVVTVSNVRLWMLQKVSIIIPEGYSIEVRESPYE